MGIDNLKEFTVNLEKFGQITVEQHRQVCQKLALDGMSKLITRSPVDTGRFRSGWSISENQPSTFVPEEGKDHYPPPDMGQAAAVANGAKEFPVLFLTNNLEYSHALSSGHSPQAPEGWVDVVVEELVAFGAAKS